MELAAARSMVTNYLRTLRPLTTKSRWVVTDVEDHGEFWLFGLTTSRALWPRRRAVHLTGNYPIAVRKIDGVACFWTLLFPFEEFAERVRSRPESLPQLDQVQQA